MTKCLFPWELSLENIKENGLDKFNYGFVYETTNKITGERYIGKRKFYNGWEKYLGSGTTLKKAINIYGRCNFFKEIIDIAYSKEELTELEIKYISHVDAVNKKCYYNISNGGDGGDLFLGKSHTEESRKKISESLSKEKNPMWGKNPYENKTEEEMNEIKNKIKASWENKSLEEKEEFSKKLKDANLKRSYEEKLIINSKKSFSHIGEKNSMWGKGYLRTKENNHMWGKKHTKESIKKMKDNAPDRFGKNNPNYGNHMSEENKQKLKESRSIQVILLNSGEIFESITSAGKKYNVDISSIIRCCKGETKSAGKDPITHGKLIWNYYK